MAKVGEGDHGYESDPEEEKRLLGMRRREAASDDEAEEKPGADRRAPVHSDESDGQGGAADYDDEEEELEEVYEDVEDDGVYEDYEEEENVTDGVVDGQLDMKEEEESARKLGDRKTMDANLEDGEEEEEEGEKAVEPFAVPTAGAFYMHDDRLRDNDGGQQRKTFGERKLWESKDDKKWGHDKFEEMNLHDRPYEQGRRGSKGRYQGRGGKNTGLDRGYGSRTRGKTFSNGDDANQATASLSVRGRGPRKYENRWKRSGQGPPTQHKQPEKSFDRYSQGSSGRYAPVSNTDSDQVPPARKNSSLSYASPPFYPSVSSNKNIAKSQKKEAQTGSTSRNPRTGALDGSSSIQHTGGTVRGKVAVDAVDIKKLYVDDSVSSKAGKFNTMQSRTQGKGMSYQSTAMQNQSNRVSSVSQHNPGQRNSVQNRVQSSVQPSSQKLGQLSGTGSQASSPPKTSLSESADVETSSESGRSRGALVGNGKGNIQGSGRGSFVYGGAQVMGAAGNLTVSHGDQNFPRAPTFLPVMQFGGQHPGGLGVPTVGMAFPGYVDGLGNSEMTWLPVLAGAAGALGASYCPPYIAVDGSYHPRPSGQTSSSKENNTTKSNDDQNRSNRLEPVNEEFGQRQKPRRYSEMDFKQPSTSA